MIPATMDFLCRRNADYVEEFLIKDGDQPIELIGIVFEIQCRSFSHGPVLFTLRTVMNNGEGIRIVDANAGVLQIFISAPTLRQAYDRLVLNQNYSETINTSYDLLITYQDGIREVWTQGIISIEPGVTNNG